MKEQDTYQRVAIPMTDKQAHEVFACETCKGFSGSLQVLKEMIERHAHVAMTSTYLNHLDLVASPDCDGQCVTGETMSIQCPCCKDRVHLNYDCYLPTEFQCPYCSADLTGGDHEKQVTIRKIIKNHNETKADQDAPSIAQQKIAMQKMLEAHTTTADAKGYGVPMQENEES